MKLSVLDQSVALAGRPADDSIRETLAMAEWCESLGYHRFWVSEHHNHDSIVGSAPEILMAAIAARTQRIRIGSAGIMLPHYAPLKVAEQFRVLNALAPGRIDLGVGRAPGSDGLTARALNPSAGGWGGDDFPANVRDLMLWVTGQPLPAGHPFAAIRAMPAGDNDPTVWMLGSSTYGAQLAGVFGLPYCFAAFITDGEGVDEALAQYRQHFRPARPGDQPRATVCLWALAADTEAEAWRLFQSRARWKIERDTGALNPLFAPEQAMEYPFTPREQARLAELKAGALVGDGAGLAAKLRSLATRWQIDELVILTWSHDPAARRRSYQLLAGEFGLTPS